MVIMSHIVTWWHNSNEINYSINLKNHQQPKEEILMDKI